MYRDRKDYEKKVDDRLKQLTKDGWFLPVYAKQVLGDAARASIQ
jgi:hypothetical protein